PAIGTGPRLGVGGPSRATRLTEGAEVCRQGNQAVTVSPWCSLPGRKSSLEPACRPRNASIYNRRPEAVLAPEIARDLALHGNLQPGERVLDVGAATGRASRARH